MNPDTINNIKETVSSGEKLANILLGYMSDADKISGGMAKARQTVESGTEQNARKMLATVMKYMELQQEENKVIISFLLMLLSSDDFIKWQAQFAIKTGASAQDVLQKMLRDKLGG